MPQLLNHIDQEIAQLRKTIKDQADEGDMEILITSLETYELRCVMEEGPGTMPWLCYVVLCYGRVTCRWNVLLFTCGQRDGNYF